MAGGPGGHEVERIAVKVVPDTSGFAEQLKKFLEEQEKKNELHINVELDTKEAEAELKKLAKNLTVKLKVELDDATVKAELERLSKNLTVKLKVEVDAKVAKAELANLGKRVKAKVETEVDDTKAKLELDRLARNRKVRIKTDVDWASVNTLGKAFSGIGSLASNIGKRIADWANSGFGEVEKAAETTTGTFSKMGDVIQAVASIATFVFWSVIITALAGVVVAALAVAGALTLAFAPALFIAAGVAFALMASKGSKAAQKLKKDFEGLKKTVKSVVSEAVQPMVKELESQLPAINKWVATLRGPLKQAFADSSKFVGTFRLGLQEFISNTLKGVVGALNNPGMKPAVVGIKHLMSDLGSAIGLFFDTLANFGPGFGKTLDALGAQLPRITTALANLVGATSAVAPDLISRIGDGITKILHAFSDPNTIKGIQLLANISFDTIVGSLDLLASALASVATNWETLKGITSTTIAFLEGLWNHFTGFLSSVGSHLGSIATTAGNGIKNGFMAGVNGLVSNGEKALNGLASYFSSMWGHIKSAASTAGNGIKLAVTRPIEAIKKSASSVVSSIKGYFSSLKQYINTVVSGVRTAVGTIERLARRAASAISKLNPFGATSIEFGDVPDGPDPRKFGPPPGFGPAGGAMAMGSFQGDLNAMQSGAARLNRSALGSFRAPSSTGTKSAVAQKVYQFGDIITTTKTTPEAVTDALTRLDALYGN